MLYDPIKTTIGKLAGYHPIARVIIYKMLDLVLLRAWYVKREIKRFAGSRQRPIEVLDAGSGFGQYTYFIASRYTRSLVSGVDLKKEQVDDCTRFFAHRKLTNARFIQADLTQFHEENKYDLAISIDVMEHIVDDVLVFKNLYHALRPGALLIISTPSDLGGSDAEDAHDESFIGEHVRNGYGMEEIKGKLMHAGFSKVEAGYSYGNPGQIAWKLSMKYPMLILGLSKWFLLLLPFYYLVTIPLCLLLNLIDVNRRHTKGTGLIVKALKLSPPENSAQ